MEKITTENNQTAIAWTWRDSSICIVLADLVTGKQRVYIKATLPGSSEAFGVKQTMEEGAKLTYKEACGFFPGVIVEDKYLN